MAARLASDGNRSRAQALAASKTDQEIAVNLRARRLRWKSREDLHISTPADSRGASAVQQGGSSGKCATMAVVAEGELAQAHHVNVRSESTPRRGESVRRIRSSSVDFDDLDSPGSGFPSPGDFLSATTPRMRASASSVDAGGGSADEDAEHGHGNEPKLPRSPSAGESGTTKGSAGTDARNSQAEDQIVKARKMLEIRSNPTPPAPLAPSDVEQADRNHDSRSCLGDDTTEATGSFKFSDLLAAWGGVWESSRQDGSCSSSSCMDFFEGKNPILSPILESPAISRAQSGVPNFSTTVSPKNGVDNSFISPRLETLRHPILRGIDDFGDFTASPDHAVEISAKLVCERLKSQSDSKKRASEETAFVERSQPGGKSCDPLGPSDTRRLQLRPPPGISCIKHGETKSPSWVHSDRTAFDISDGRNVANAEPYSLDGGSPERARDRQTTRAGDASPSHRQRQSAKKAVESPSTSRALRKSIDSSGSGPSPLASGQPSTGDCTAMDESAENLSLISSSRARAVTILPKLPHSGRQSSRSSSDYGNKMIVQSRTVQSGDQDASRSKPQSLALVVSKEKPCPNSRPQPRSQSPAKIFRKWIVSQFRFGSKRKKDNPKERIPRQTQSQSVGRKPAMPSGAPGRTKAPAESREKNADSSSAPTRPRTSAGSSADLNHAEALEWLQQLHSHGGGSATQATTLRTSFPGPTKFRGFPSLCTTDPKSLCSGPRSIATAETHVSTPPRKSLKFLESPEIVLLNDFLRTTRNSVGSQSKTPHARLRFVSSGPSSGVSSMVSAICYGYLMEKKGAAGVWNAVPVIDCPRWKMNDHLDAAWLFHVCGVDVQAMLFSNEVDVEGLKETGVAVRTEVVGENVLKRRDTVRSCCTLLAELFMEDAEDVWSQSAPFLKTLLLAGLLLDTNNLTSKSTTSLDHQILINLTTGAGPLGRFGLYDRLTTVHTDPEVRKMARKYFGSREDRSTDTSTAKKLGNATSPTSDKGSPLFSSDDGSGVSSLSRSSSGRSLRSRRGNGSPATKNRAQHRGNSYTGGSPTNKIQVQPVRDRSSWYHT